MHTFRSRANKRFKNHMSHMLLEPLAGFAQLDTKIAVLRNAILQRATTSVAMIGANTDDIAEIRNLVVRFETDNRLHTSIMLQPPMQFQ